MSESASSLEAQINVSWEHLGPDGRPATVVYRCPLNQCGPAWMAGGAIWQHLRGRDHVLSHFDATQAIKDARKSVFEWDPPSASEGEKP